MRKKKKCFCEMYLYCVSLTKRKKEERKGGKGEKEIKKHLFVLCKFGWRWLRRRVKQGLDEYGTFSNVNEEGV
jgi:hypothetical protein